MNHHNETADVGVLCSLPVTSGRSMLICLSNLQHEPPQWDNRCRCAVLSACLGALGQSVVARPCCFTFLKLATGAAMRSELWLFTDLQPQARLRGRVLRLQACGAPQLTSHCCSSRKHEQRRPHTTHTIGDWGALAALKSHGEVVMQSCSIL